jgi:hypothetical protein
MYKLALKARERDELKIGSMKDCTKLGLQIKMSKTFFMHYLQAFKELETWLLRRPH